MRAVTKSINLLAADLGAGSGRVIEGNFDGSKISIRDVYRFPNDYVTIKKSLYWDVLYLWNEIKKGLRLGVTNNGGLIDGISVDTWGADFCMFDRNDNLISNPYCYRDSRTSGILNEIYKLISREELYHITGNQPMEISTLCQLYSMVINDESMYKIVKSILPIANTFTFFLSGEKLFDFSNASGTLFYDFKKRNWSEYILKKLGIDINIMPVVKQDGTVIGNILDSVANETGAKNARIINTGGHDTALAIIAAPSSEEEYLHISSGTWSVVGVKKTKPVTNLKALDYGLTNFGTPDGKHSLCKIITGLWIIQECRHYWKENNIVLSYDEISRLIEQEKGFASIIDVNDSTFISPGNMPYKIKEFCISTKQKKPETIGQVARCVYESLALKYRETIDEIEEVMGKKFNTVYLMGGGSCDPILCQFTSDASGKNVVAGPREATAAGNIIMQLIALGEIRTIDEAKDVLKQTIKPELFVPKSRYEWEEAYFKYKNVKNIRTSEGCVS